jgi:hypothetical protein
MRQKGNEYKKSSHREGRVVEVVQVTISEVQVHLGEARPGAAASVPVVVFVTPHHRYLALVVRCHDSHRDVLVIG